MKTTAARKTRSSDQNKPWIWTQKHDPIDDVMKSNLIKNYQIPPTRLKSPPHPEIPAVMVVLTEEEKA
jgi:hypothetical protein